MFDVAQLGARAFDAFESSRGDQAQVEKEGRHVRFTLRPERCSKAGEVDENAVQVAAARQRSGEQRSLSAQ